MNTPARVASRAPFAALLLGVAAPLASAQEQMNVARLWAENCISCHAQDASKDLRNLTNIPTGELDRPFYDAIENGVPDMGMNAYGDSLTPEEMWALTVYIRELQFRDARQRGMGTEIKPNGSSGTWTTTHHDFRIEEMLRPGVVDIPWSVEPLPEGGAIVTDRSGAVHVLKPDGSITPPIRNTPDVQAVGQGGMMDVALDPDYANNGLVYLAYTDPGADMGRDRRGRPRVATMTRVERGRIEDNTWVPVNTVFKAPDNTYVPTGFHFGVRLVFDDEGHVFVPIGDRGIMEMAQDLSRPNGKVHRVKTDGTVPDDNPCVDVEGALQTIWSLGHRNPQGLVMDLQGRLWDTEHGPRGGDELNLVKRAHNYGWPVVSFGINYSGMPFETPRPDQPPASRTAEPAGPGSDPALDTPAHAWTPPAAAPRPAPRPRPPAPPRGGGLPARAPPP